MCRVEAPLQGLAANIVQLFRVQSLTTMAAVNPE
jgi:hypothetical protein